MTKKKKEIKKYMRRRLKLPDLQEPASRLRQRQRPYTPGTEQLGQERRISCPGSTSFSQPGFCARRLKKRADVFTAFIMEEMSDRQNSFVGFVQKDQIIFVDVTLSVFL